jgi:hypothetical protein
MAHGVAPPLRRLRLTATAGSATRRASTASNQATIGTNGANASAHHAANAGWATVDEHVVRGHERAELLEVGARDRIVEASDHGCGVAHVPSPGWSCSRALFGRPPSTSW